MIIRAAWLLSAVLFAALTLAPAVAAPPEPVAAAGAVPERPYTTRIEGAEGDLLQALTDISQLVAREDTPPASLASLRRRADGDMTRMDAVLRARGYFDARVAFTIEDAEPAAGSGQLPPLVVTVRIVPGARFTLVETAVTYLDAGTPEVTGDLPRTLPGDAVAAGEPARAAAIIEAENALVGGLRDRGFPFAGLAGRKAVANVDTHKLAVTTEVRLGPRARFGPLTVDGLVDVERRFIDQRIAWQEGELYDASKIRQTRQTLAASGLFEIVRFTPAEAPDPDGVLPLTLTVAERARRTIGGGVYYASTEGLGVRGFWENRNLLGNGQNLRLEADISQIEQSALARYRIAGFRRADQVLELAFVAGLEETDAYDRTGGVLSAAIERPLGGKWSGRAGVFADASRVDEADEPADYATLVGLELRTIYESIDNPLDPTRGIRLLAGAVPQGGHYQEPLGFAQIDGELRGYLPVVSEGRLVVAARGKIGSILGARTGEIPAHKRLYAGGAGSVRGFEYQEVSPLGEDGRPKGGRSLVEFGGELRWRITDTIGIVPFVDAGLVSDAPHPDFGEKMAWGAGLGFRYYAPFGPVGIDLAYPLATPSKEDPSLKLYVTLGQAF